MEFKGDVPEKSTIECIPYDEKYFEDYKRIMNAGYYELRKANGIEPYECMAENEDLGDDPECVFLLVKDGELIGSVGCYGNELDNLVVDERYQNKGWGTKLTLWGMEHIREQNDEPITLEVLAWNKKAKRIYDKVGFILTEILSVDPDLEEENYGVRPFITLHPVDDTNRDAVLALSVREDQPFVAPNDWSLKQAEETEAKAPGVARPFAIYADDKLVGFTMFAFDPSEEDEEDKYWLWRFMIDQNEQGKGYGQGAMAEIIKYFRDNGADRLYLSTEPENEVGVHVYHKFGFKETGVIEEGEAVMMRML